MALSTAACSQSANQSAVCSATEASRAGLAAALVEDGGPVSRRAGLLVIEQMAAGCG